MPVRTGEHILSLMGYVGEKLYIDLVLMSDTVRGNGYLLMVEDSFSRYCFAYPIPKKEAGTLAKVLMDQHFNIWVIRPVTLRQWQRIHKQSVERIVLRVQDTTYYNSAL